MVGKGAMPYPTAFSGPRSLLELLPSALHPNGTSPKFPMVLSQKRRDIKRVEAFNSTKASMHTKHFYMGHYLGSGLG